MSKANALENEIFDHYRKRVNQIEKSINLLRYLDIGILFKYSS